MRITEIEINNFKAFYGKYNIDLTSKGKNLLVYGENGSGKSSLFSALKQLFNSSQNAVDLDKFDNIFLKDSEKGNNYIKLTFRQQAQPNDVRVIELSRTGLNTQNTFITDTNKVKAFLDYRKIMRTHLSIKDKPNLFNLIALDVLGDIVNPVSNNTFIEDWKLITNYIKKRTNSWAYDTAKNSIKNFRDGLKILLDTIKPDVNGIVSHFGYNVGIDFYTPGLSLDYKTITNDELYLEIDFFDKSRIPDYHTFLNEARLNAIAISIYLAAILNYPQASLQHKILVFDDVLIGLDSSNRIPLLKVLEDKFSDYQIFISTFDLHWFSLADMTIDKSKWETLKLFVGQLDGNNFEIPIMQKGSTYLEKAEYYISNHDYKASSVYVRTAFEETLKKYCDKKSLRVKYSVKPGKVSSNDFWEAVKDYKVSGTLVITDVLKNEVEAYRSIVLNPFVHHDLERPQYKIDLQNAINTVKNLQTVLGV